jgi:hypothetical protein
MDLSVSVVDRVRTHLGVLSLLLVAAASLGLLLSGCGDSSSDQDEIEAARQQGAAKARQQAKIRQIQKELKELKKGGSGGSAAPVVPGRPSSAPENSAANSSGNCGGSLAANENTTCGFAANVEQAYFEEIGSGSGTVIAYSPTTGQTYSMYCTAGSPHECTGGNSAAVYFP